MGKYQNYLEGEGWKSKRRATMARVKSKAKRSVFQCEKCSEFFHTDVIEVHHKTYVDIGNEKQKQLLVLCKWCHSEIHGKNDFVLLGTQTKDTYRILFRSDMKALSDGEMNYKRNEIIKIINTLD